MTRGMSESEFLELCDLDIDKPSDRATYFTMKEEALGALGQLMLRDHQATLHSGLHALTEQAVSQQIAYVFEKASPKTKSVYLRVAADYAGDNWILRWMLFHEYCLLTEGT